MPDRAPPPPRTGDLDLLRYLSQGLAASVAAERCALTLADVAVRTSALRQHYDVTSTAAAVDQAVLLGHVPQVPHLPPSA